jgi:hypothetical protein
MLHTTRRRPVPNRMINILIREFAPKQTVADQNALEQFQKQWSTYQKLVDADALSHRAAGKLLHDALYAIPRPFAFVDIACGDASQMREVLPPNVTQLFLDPTGFYGLYRYEV